MNSYLHTINQFVTLEFDVHQLNAIDWGPHIVS